MWRVRMNDENVAKRRRELLLKLWSLEISKFQIWQIGIDVSAADGCEDHKDMQRWASICVTHHITLNNLNC